MPEYSVINMAAGMMLVQILVEHSKILLFTYL